MDGYVLWGRLEQLGHQGLCEPERLVLEPTINAGPTVLSLIEEDFALRRY